MKPVIKFLMPLCFLIAPVVSMGHSLCIINNLHDDMDIAYINATISLNSNGNDPIKQAELYYISNTAPFNKTCAVTTSATLQYKSSDKNNAIQFTVEATPGGDFALSVNCQVLYPSSWGYPNYAVAKITGNTSTNGPYTCLTCATQSSSCNPQ